MAPVGWALHVGKFFGDTHKHRESGVGMRGGRAEMDYSSREP